MANSLFWLAAVLLCGSTIVQDNSAEAVVAKERPSTKQGRVNFVSSVSQRQTPNFGEQRFFYNPRFPPIPLRPRRPPSRPAANRQTSSDSNGDLAFLLIALFSFLRSQSTQTSIATTAGASTTTATTVSISTPAVVTAPTTAQTTTDSSSTTATTACPWGAWGTCSLPCKGTRTRSRTCRDETETEYCNTEIGFVATTGWYRASNCHEYTLSAQYKTGTDSKKGCEDLGYRLAATGMRDDIVRQEIMSALKGSNLNVVYVHIGVDKTGGSYVWHDGVTADPTFWFVGEPGAADCVVMALGNAYSAHDTSCNAQHNYICEREAE